MLNLLILLDIALIVLFWFTVLLIVVTQNRLRKQIKDKQELLSIASHELSAPLTHIKGTLSLVAKEPTLSATTQSFVGRALNSVDQLSHLIDDLLTVSRFEMGKVKINPQPVCLADILNDVVSQFQGDGVNPGVRLQVVSQNIESIKVLADADRLREVLNNLLTNALKYGISPITVSARQKDRGVVVCVADCGAGVSPEDAKKLFNRFVRLVQPAGAVSAHKGAGLGLYICRLIVEAHQGKIWVESPSTGSGPAGKGSKFCFSLPFV